MEENKVYDIDTILDMLNGLDNDTETQERGIEEGKKVRNLEAFIRPYCGGRGKSVWYNCARILSSKSDQELEPHIYNLLEWLADRDWPGYDIILQRLLEYKNAKDLSIVITWRVKEAIAEKDIKWLIDMKELLQNKNVAENLPKETKYILENVSWDDEDEE